MYKVSWLVRFNKSGREDAQRYWDDVHGPGAAEAPGVESYVHNNVIGPIPTESGSGQEKVFYDGHACAWFADRDDFQASMRSAEWKDLFDRAAEHFDMSWVWGMSGALDERPIEDGDTTDFKVIWIGRYKSGMDPAAASEHWTNTHGQLLLKSEPRVTRYVQNHVIEAIGPDGPKATRPAFDGFSEAWYEDEDTFLRSIRTPEFAALIEDGYNVFEQGDMWGAQLAESVLKAGAGVPR